MYVTISVVELKKKKFTQYIHLYEKQIYPLDISYKVQFFYLIFF